MITTAIGKAAMIETACKFAIVLSLKSSAIGSIIKRIAQNSFIFVLASSLSPICLYEYADATSVIESNDVE